MSPAHLVTPSVMPLIIDCNNVLHAPKPTALAGLDVAELCRALVRAGWVGRGVTVVCDGHAGPLGLVESPVEEVELVYAGHGRTADALIIERINQNTAPRRLVVVSSDREIRRAAQRRRAMAWSSEYFLRQLAAALTTPAGHEADKPADEPLPASEVRRWLEQFGIKGDEGDAEASDGSELDEDSRYWPPW